MSLPPYEEWPSPPRAWRGEAEAALIDAILSMGASYGTSPAAIPRLIALWRLERNIEGQLDDLNVLAQCDAVKLADFLENHQRVPGPNGMTKAASIIAAAKALVAAGFPDSVSLVADGLNGNAAVAYLSVPGLGKVTWTHLMALVGAPK